jgi:hypothetical protein
MGGISVNHMHVYKSAPGTHVQRELYNPKAKIDWWLKNSSMLWQGSFQN